MGKPWPCGPWGHQEMSEKGLRELGRMCSLWCGRPVACLLVPPGGLEAPGLSHSTQDLVANSLCGWLRETDLCGPWSLGWGGPGPTEAAFAGPSLTFSTSGSLLISPAPQLLLPAVWPPLLTQLAQGPDLLSTKTASAPPGVLAPAVNCPVSPSQFPGGDGLGSGVCGLGREWEGRDLAGFGGGSGLTDVSPRKTLLLGWEVATWP